MDKVRLELTAMSSAGDNALPKLTLIKSVDYLFITTAGAPNIAIKSLYSLVKASRALAAAIRFFMFHKSNCRAQSEKD
jgi:hypothetical protein